MRQLPESYSKILLAIPKGKENAIPVSYLMEKLRIDKGKRREVNMIIESLVMNYEIPIGTSSDSEYKGIFFIDNEEDLKLACHTLNSRAMANLKRHKKLIENFNKGNQVSLEV